MRFALLAASAALAFAITGCHSAGPYGHSVKYVPLDEETTASNGARDYDPVMVERQPEEWRKGTVSLFGVVESRTAGPGGAAMVKLSVRRLEPRNLCQSEQDEDSCRVTVSDKDFGTVWAVVPVHGDDDSGPRSVQQRSLVRVVGTLGQELAPADGTRVVHATWYRHWPVYFYVTRASARDMRQ